MATPTPSSQPSSGATTPKAKPLPTPKPKSLPIPPTKPARLETPPTDSGPSSPSPSPGGSSHIQISPRISPRASPGPRISPRATQQVTPAQEPAPAQGIVFTPIPEPAVLPPTNDQPTTPLTSPHSGRPTGISHRPASTRTLAGSGSSKPDSRFETLKSSSSNKIPSKSLVGKTKSLMRFGKKTSSANLTYNSHGTSEDSSDHPETDSDAGSGSSHNLRTSAPSVSVSTDFKFLSKDLPPIYARRSTIQKLVLTEEESKIEEEAALKKIGALVSNPELDQKRAYIVKEILMTEEQYVGSMQKCVTKYYKPMLEQAKSDAASTEAIHTMFKTMTDVILPLNTDLLQELKARIEKWEPDSLISDIFIKFGRFLKLYTVYSQTFQGQSDALILVSTQPWFPHICEAKVYIETELIKPVQRLPRYALLLDDLWKSTPASHADSKGIGEALHLIKSVATHLNSELTKFNNFFKLTNDGLEFLFAEPNRSFVIDETIEVEHNQKRSKQQVWLFNDLIAMMDVSLTKKKAKDPKDMQLLPLQLLWLQSEIEGSSIILVGPCLNFTFNFSNPEAYERWWTALNTEIGNCLRNLLGTEANIRAEIQDPPVPRKWLFSWNDFCVYDGWWENGKMHGEGILESRGSQYEGEFVNNRKTGKGTMLFITGATYTGEFLNGKPHGQGEMNQCGCVYVGAWVNGKKHGPGNLYFSNGDTFIGHFENDYIQNNGKTTASDARGYSGGFHQSQYHGHGVLTDFYGNYDGEFVNGNRQGQGTLKHANGMVSTGNWVAGYLQGNAKIHYPNGFYEGNLEKGQRKGNGSMRYRNGSSYQGQWSEGLRWGTGAFESISGDGFIRSYAGDWIKGKKSGKGIIVFLDGSSYEGAIVDDLPHGEGVQTFTRGSIVVRYKGKWFRGIRDGKCTFSIEQNEQKIVSIVVDPEDSSDSGKLKAQFLLPALMPVVAWDR